MPQEAFKSWGKIWSGTLGPVMLKGVDSDAVNWTLDRKCLCPGRFVVEVVFTGPPGKFFLKLLGTRIRIVEFSMKQ